MICKSFLTMGMANCHVCKGHIYAEGHIQVCAATQTSSSETSLHASLSKTMPRHILHMLEQHAFIVKET